MGEHTFTAAEVDDLEANSARPTSDFLGYESSSSMWQALDHAA
jgi:hypothetical protein